MSEPITGTENVITLSDVVARSSDLRNSLAHHLGGFEPGDILDRDNDLDDDVRDQLEELQSLEEVIAEASYALENGTLIAEHHFGDYARQFAEDIGAISSASDWPAQHIDWEAAINSMQQDYKQIDVRGNLYWIRA